MKYELGEEEVVDDSGEPVEMEEEAEALPEGMTLLATEEEGGNIAEEEPK